MNFTGAVILTIQIAEVYAVIFNNINGIDYWLCFPAD